MAKVKRGLGETTLIQDLTKPMDVHISEALEPPPMLERRKGLKRADREALEDVGDINSPGSLFARVSSSFDTGDVKIIFHFNGMQESVLVEMDESSKKGECSVKSVLLRGGEISEQSWGTSSFSDINREDIIKELSGCVSGVEVITDEEFLKFSSVDDFREWLDS